MCGDGNKYIEKRQPAMDAKICTAPPKSAFTRLLLFILPLAMVFVWVAVLGPKSFDWAFKFRSRSSSVAWSSGGGGSNSDLNDRGGGAVSSYLPDSVRVVDEDVKVADGRKNFAKTESSDNAALVKKPGTVRKDYTKLNRLEAGLQKARTAIRNGIRENHTNMEDQDFVPNGPMYWNYNAFLRSYLEMEKKFKIYVYPEGEPPLFHNGPCKSIYSSEGNFIHMLEMDRHFRSSDPEKAHVFFLPFSVTMMMSFVYDSSNSHGFAPVKRTVVDYINVIAEKYPFWNRSLGADHFMLSCHDKGPKASRSVPNLSKNSIRVLCNANTSEGFVPSKDVSLPEINLITGNVEGFLGGPSPLNRTILAFFAGGRHGRIRPILLQHWENKDPEMQVHQYLPKEVSYYEMMKKSKFCLCPSGYEVASPRIVEALYVGCVPVLLSRSYVAPFSDVLNWKTFSVIVPVKDIPNLKQILSNISTKSYIKMQRRGVQVRRHFVVNSPPKRFDVYHMILHSVWLRRLNIGIQGDQAQ